MAQIVSVILLVCALVLMFAVSKFVDRRGEHTRASICIVIAVVCLVFASVMALYVFQ